MNVRIAILVAYPHRLQIHLPARAFHWINQVESLKHIHRHKEGHYSMMYHPWSLPQLNKLFGDALLVDFDKTKYPPRAFEKRTVINKRKSKRPRPKHQSAVDALEKWICLKQYSWATLKSYKHHFTNFLLYYNDIPPADIDKEQIEHYLYEQIAQRGISESAQNQIINAIKCYYEKVLERPSIYYNLVRPKKKQSLPQVLSSEEVQRLLEAIPNLKHQTVLMVVYSAGLRLGEVIRLRVDDIQRAQRKIFIKGGKNKKDRYTLLSNQFIAILDTYLMAYKPDYWLFEGQDGGTYSRRSVQQIFRKAVERAKLNKHYTLHSLRHSFATHLLEQGVDIRYIQELLGHTHVDTTMIYTHVTQAHLKNIDSPLDRLKVKSVYMK